MDPKKGEYVLRTRKYNKDELKSFTGSAEEYQKQFAEQVAELLERAGFPARVTYSPVRDETRVYFSVKGFQKAFAGK